MFEIFCLMVERIGLTNNMRTMLFKAAKVMVEEKKGHLHVETDDFEALIQTDFRYAVFGGLYGIEFVAEIVSVRGEGKAHYIVRTRDLELASGEGFWLDIDPRLIPPSEEKIRAN